MSKPAIPKWVPLPVRAALIEIIENADLPSTVRKAIRRVSSSTAMRGVWEVLPGEPEKGPELLVREIAIAVGMFDERYPRSRLPPPPPKRDRNSWDAWAAKVAEHLRQNPSKPTLQDAFFHAQALAEAMQLTTDDDIASGVWAMVGGKGPDVGFSEAKAVVERVGTFYAEMHRVVSELYKGLPTVKSLGHRRAKEQFFTQAMSAAMQKTYGRPYDEIVATLAQVVFNRSGAVDADTVKKRRRAVHRGKT
jgi:hypothetical protein